MSQQIYNFIRFLQKKEGREPPLQSILKYGDKSEVTDSIQLDAVKKDDFDAIKELLNADIVPSDEVMSYMIAKHDDAYNLISFILSYGLVPSENIQILAIENNPYTFYVISRGPTINNKRIPYNPSSKVKKIAYDKIMEFDGEISDERMKYFN